MTENKSLAELAKEYETAERSLKEIISAKRSRLCLLRNLLCSNEAYVLKSELKTLYAQHREAREIAEYLKTYYEPHDGKRELFLY